MKTLMIALFLFACGGEPVPPTTGDFTYDPEEGEVYEDMEPDNRPSLGGKIPCYHQEWDGCRPLPDKRDYLINPNPESKVDGR